MVQRLWPMENQDRKAVSRIVYILRRTTRVVQLLPFAYLVVYALLLFTERYIPDSVYSVINELLNVPTAVILLFIFLSHLLKLCAWHKVACLIPLISRAINAFDGFVMALTEQEVVIINTTIGIGTTLFIIVAIKKLLGNGFKAATH